MKKHRFYQRLKPLLLALLVCGCCVAVNPPAKVQAAVNGFQTANGKTYYYKDGVRHKGWLTLGKNRYYFSMKDGAQLKGWAKNKKGQYRYFTKGSGVMATGWMTNSKGQMRYFSKKAGIMATKWLRNSKGQLRYFSSQKGIMARGWLTNSKGQMRYFSKKAGIMAEGWLTDSKNNTRYFYPQNGVMATGWFSYKGNNYYFRSNGAMYRNTTVTIGGRTYLFDSNGIARESQDKWDKLLAQYRNDASTNQLVFVQHLGGSRAQVMMYSKSGGSWQKVVSCIGYVGRNGINKTREGDGKTPTGTFNLTGGFGIRDNPGARMPYTKINDYLYWCSDKTHYNQLIDIRQYPHTCRGEHLIDYVPHYDYGMFTDYNREGVYGKGSAIFLHRMGSNPYTGGCIAVPQADMIRILQMAQPGAKICIYEQ